MSGGTAVRGALASRRRRLRAEPGSWAAAVTLVGSVAWLIHTPLVPDLAAQVARTRLVHQSGVITWWTGWYGGTTLPDYSVIGPWVMALVGVRVTGVLAALFGALALARLAEDSLRPRAAAVAFAVGCLADVVDGRITFALGFAVGCWALVALRSLPADREARRPRILLLVLAALATYACSPLAGLFLGIALAAVAVLDRSRRAAALVPAAVLVVLAATFAALFPATGIMPFRPTDIIPAGLGCLGVLVLCANRVVRLGAGLVLLTALWLLLFPTAVGTNITRIAWIAAAALVIAYCRLPAVVATVLALSLAIWPTADLVRQLSRAESPSASVAFYAPLSTALAREGATPDSGQRLEVVDSGDHWAVAFLPGAPALARGWDRQSDRARNPLFYVPNALDAQTYRSWLRELAVGWVAVPTVAHDYAAVAEAKLVNSGLPYLDEVWSSPDWTLYRVTDATPLADGARVDRVDAAGVTLTTTGDAPVRLRLRWSAHLTVRTPAGRPASGACLRDDGGFLVLTVPGPGTYQVVSQFNPLAPLADGRRCVA